MSIKPWSYLDEQESLACPKTALFNNKLGCFEYKLKRLSFKTTYLFVEWGSYSASQ